MTASTFSDPKRGDDGRFVKQEPDPRELRERFWSRVDQAGPNGCWVWTGTKRSKGYGVIYSGRQFRAHRLSYEWAFGSIPNGMEVCHTCDNPSCVNPGHLFVGTMADNQADKVAKGRQQRGETHYFALLTEADVLAIRWLRKNRWGSAKEIAAWFGVSHWTIYSVARGKLWRHL